jgi:quercetin dioxygenase-like cupin family protein
MVVGDDHPYDDEKLNKNEFIRTFSCEVLDEELKWHYDLNDRIVEVLEGEGWLLQFDDSLPTLLEVGDVIYIPARLHHRIKCGTSDLKIRIREYMNE